METGICECGCGLTTPVHVQTRKSKGHIKGQHARFVKGHNNTKPPTPYETGEIVKYCECGCGEKLVPAKKAEAGQVKKGEVRRFISGHNTSRGEFEYRDNTPWKKCQKCNEWKRVNSGFHAKKGSVWGNNPCKECFKVYRQENLEYLRARDKGRRWRRWGMTDEQFVDLYEKLDGRCQICLESVDIDEINCDHNHETNEFRGLLCSGCNLGLGHFKDDTTRLTNAKHYLEY